MLPVLAGGLISFLGGRAANKAGEKAAQNTWNNYNTGYGKVQNNAALTGMGGQWNQLGLRGMQDVSDFARSYSERGPAQARGYEFDTTINRPETFDYMGYPRQQEDVNAEFARDPYGVKQQMMNELQGGGMLQASTAPAALQQQRMLAGQIAQLKRDPALRANPAALARAIQELQTQANSAYLGSVQGNVGDWQKSLLGMQGQERAAAAQNYGQRLSDEEARMAKVLGQRGQLSAEEQAMLQARGINAGNLTNASIANAQQANSYWGNLGSILLGQARTGLEGGMGYYGQNLQDVAGQRDYWARAAGGAAGAQQAGQQGAQQQYSAFGQGLGQMYGDWMGSRGGGTPSLSSTYGFTPSFSNSSPNFGVTNTAWSRPVYNPTFTGRL